MLFRRLKLARQNYIRNLGVGLEVTQAGHADLNQSKNKLDDRNLRSKATRSFVSQWVILAFAIMLLQPNSRVARFKLLSVGGGCFMVELCMSLFDGRAPSKSNCHLNVGDSTTLSMLILDSSTALGFQFTEWRGVLCRPEIATLSAARSTKLSGNRSKVESRNINSESPWPNRNPSMFKVTPPWPWNRTIRIARFWITRFSIQNRRFSATKACPVAFTWNLHIALCSVISWINSQRHWQAQKQDGPQADTICFVRCLHASIKAAHNLSDGIWPEPMYHLNTCVPITLRRTLATFNHTEAHRRTRTVLQ